MSTPKVKLFTLPTCGPCKAIKHGLTNRGIPFEEVDVSQDQAGYAEWKALGYSQTPVTLAPDGSHWFGLDPRRLGDLAAFYGGKDAGSAV